MSPTCCWRAQRRREREIAVRAALGAGRWRLVRQFIVESLALSAAGAILGVILAYWMVQALRGAMPEGVPRVATIALDVRVLAATAGVSLITGLLFGLVPAWQMSKPNLNNALNDGTRGASAGRARQRLRSALVVVEVALAVVLLVGAALFIGSFVRVMRIDPGFQGRRRHYDAALLRRRSPGSAHPTGGPRVRSDLSSGSASHPASSKRPLQSPGNSASGHPVAH